MKSYGTIRRERNRWLLEVEPHVALRAKRVFERVSKRDMGRIVMHDTEETARELLWFLERYPLSFAKEEDAQWLEERAAAHREREDIVSELLEGRRPAREFKLALPPRDYQRVAAELWLRMGGILIADDLGTGKSATAICGLTDARTRPALVVAPVHLQRQWQREIGKFAPELRTHILKKGTPYDLSRPNGGKPGQMALIRDLPDVIITSYHKLAGWAETLAPVVRSVVFDEVQELRRGNQSNKGAAAYHIARHVKFRCGLSATPFYNYGGELHAVMEALRPGALGTREEFVREWCINSYHDKPRIIEPKSFGTYLREQALMIRRTREDVGTELPPLTKTAHEVDCDLKPLQDVKSSASELARVILSQNPEGRGVKLRASEELSNMLRQATGIAKATYVADFVRLLVESGEKVVLYGWHRAVYEIWKERLQDLVPVMYTGTESVTKKEWAKECFVEDRTKLLIMSLRSGAGLDGLQGCCRTLCFGELDWSPGVHEQCIGRLYRDGQSDHVLAYYLYTDGGADPTILDVLGLKRAQIEGVRDPYRDLVEKLDTDGDHIRRMAAAYLQKGN
jgi:SNF2 family DNA or RNA helicase